MAPNTPSWTALLAVAAGGAFALVNYVPSHQSHGHLSGIAIFFVFFGALIVGRVTYTAVLWPKYLSPLRHLPQAPGGTFFNGHFSEILAADTGSLQRKWINEIPNDGLIRYTMLGNAERVILTNPKAIGETLVSKSYDYKKPQLARESLGRLLGIGVLLAEGEEHKFQRKHLMPAFQYRHIKNLVPTFWSYSGKLVKLIEKEIESKIVEKPAAQEEGVVVNFSGYINRATLDIIGVTGMGFDFGALDDPDNELSITYREIFAPSPQARRIGMIGLFVPLSWLLKLPLKRNRDVNKAAQKIRAESRRVIENKQREMKEKGSDEHKDILSVALESGAFTVDNLVDQTMTFLAAGHETTATSTVWAMLALSQHPEMQTRLREEIRDKLPPLHEDSQVTAEMIDKLPYLHAVCQEVLRFYPPVPFTRREVMHDTTILGHHIPIGTDVIIVPFGVNFATSLWGDDADQFNPDRWMGHGRGNSGGADSAYSNLTFLHGPRSCIGSSFAKHEIACLVAAIIGRFEVELEPKDRKIELQNGIVTRPKNGLPLRMKVVEGW